MRIGQPIRILDLAREMIRLSELEPDVDIKIEFTGIRPGERLFEELHTEGETVEPTPHKDIVKLWMRQGEGVDVAWLEHGLSLLADAAASVQPGEVGRGSITDRMADGFSAVKAEISTLPQRPECGKKQYCTARDADLPE